MNKKIADRKLVVGIIGPGYVGLPLGVAFAEEGFNIIAYDYNPKRIDELSSGHDSTNEVDKETFFKLKNKIKFTSQAKDLSSVDVFIVTVPTPITSTKEPDLTALRSASKVVGENLNEGNYVIYESTVYPGLTEDICLPILEKTSNLKVIKDFKIGYSPERINPGDKVNTIRTIKKIVSGIDGESLEFIHDLYSTIIKAGLHKAKSIKVAEAAKVIENTQRDVNIALMNELSMIFNRMGINTWDVLEAAGTKWNFLKFTPGLVGGHCIGVDPYYLLYRSQGLNYLPELMGAARRVNEVISRDIATNTVKLLSRVKKNILDAKILVLGCTFKPNVPDARNSKVFELIQELEDYGAHYDLVEPFEVDVEYDTKNLNTRFRIVGEIKSKYDCIIYAVDHDQFKDFTLEVMKKCATSSFVLVDIPGKYRSFNLENYWTL